MNVSVVLPSLSIRNGARIASLVVLLLGVLPGPVQGAAVFLAGENEPVYGYLVSADDAKVVLDVLGPDGRLARTEFPRERVEDLLVTVSPERLQNLAPDDPLGYLQYAEELSIKKQDPEARDAARRLFLIAGSLAPQIHGRQAALGLANVAASEDEARRARTLASLIDPSGSVSETAVAAPAAQKIDAGLARVMIAGFQAYRRGDVATAKRAFENDGVARLLSSLDPPVPLERVRDSLAEKEFQADHAVLAAIVPLERSLRMNGTLAPAGNDAAEDPFAEQNRLPVAWPTWKNVTPFDPAETIFRDGRWQRP